MELSEGQRNTSKRSVALALFLSALLFPGSGHYYLQQRAWGAVFSSITILAGSATLLERLLQHNTNAPAELLWVARHADTALWIVGLCWCLALLHLWRYHR